MITTDLHHVVWSDIESLILAETEEDDSLEFKSRFKGGDDFTTLTESQRNAALDGLCREVLAFLNTRGGDLLIGIEEDAGPRPRASKAIGVLNAAESAERIARGLAAIVEPAQTNVAFRVLDLPSQPDRGVILIRVQPSIRAPHRSRRTKECYVRRGSESVPMAMDEIQDLTLYRARLRLEQLELLETQFRDFRDGKSQYQLIETPAIFIRTVAFPVLEHEIPLDDTLLSAFGKHNPGYFDASGRNHRNDVAFRNLTGRWKPMLRGRIKQSYDEQVDVDNTTFLYSSKTVKQSGVLIWDFAARYYEKHGGASFHFEWVIGYLAQICADIEALGALQQRTFPLILRTELRSKGDMTLLRGERMWGEAHKIADQTATLPDFSIEGPMDLETFFQQAQADILSVASLHGEVFTLKPLNTGEDGSRSPSSCR